MTACVVMRHRSKLDQLRALRTRAAPLTSSAGRGRRAAKGSQATLTNSSCLFSHLLSFFTTFFPFGHSEPYSKVTTCRTASFRLATLTTTFKAVPKAGTRSQHAGSTPRESLGLTHCPPPPSSNKQGGSRFREDASLSKATPPVSRTEQSDFQAPAEGPLGAQAFPSPASVLSCPPATHLGPAMPLHRVLPWPPRSPIPGLANTHPTSRTQPRRHIPCHGLGPTLQRHLPPCPHTGT